MFRALKFLVWTGCAVGLGLYLSTFEFGGKSPVVHVERFWKQQANGASFRSLKSKFGAAWGEAQDAVPAAPKPKEHHSNEDRDAVNKLIAKHGSQKG